VQFSFCNQTRQADKFNYKAKTKKMLQAGGIKQEIAGESAIITQRLSIKGENSFNIFHIAQSAIIIRTRLVEHISPRNFPVKNEHRAMLIEKKSSSCS
jgi:hypothetical protein